MKGRKRKPREIIIMEGNRGKRNLDKDGHTLRSDDVKRAYSEITKKKIVKEAKEKEGNKKRRGGCESGTPFCPAWLDIMAKREWRRIAPVLKKLGLLTVIDRTALAGYCQSYARWRNAEMLITKHNMYYKKKDTIKTMPFVREAQKYLEICKAMCVEFGMTPSSRGRMMMPGESVNEKDEFGNLLNE